jgi:hypothetical protein
MSTVLSNLRHRSQAKKTQSNTSARATWSRMLAGLGLDMSLTKVVALLVSLAAGAWAVVTHPSEALSGLLQVVAQGAQSLQSRLEQEAGQSLSPLREDAAAEELQHVRGHSDSPSHGHPLHPPSGSGDHVDQRQ